MEHVLSKYLQNPALIDEISVDDLEARISTEPFNVVLQLLFSHKMGDLRKDHSDFSVRNTLYPYLSVGFSNSHRIQNFKLENIEPTTTLENVKTESGDHILENEHKQIHSDSEYSELSEQTAEESLTEKVSVGERIPPGDETLTQNMVESTLSHQIVIPEEPEYNKNLKKMKVQNVEDISISSSFTEWLLSKKQIGTSPFTKKKKKKNHIHMSAQKSITPSDEIISESLAKILKTQGHLLEAKKMFKKLIVQQPDNTERYIKEIEDINVLMEEKD